MSDSHKKGPRNLLGRAYLAAFAASTWVNAAQNHLPQTAQLTGDGDLSMQMVAGIDRFLEAETTKSAAAREQFWRIDFSSAEAYDKSIAPNRVRLAKMLGVVDPLVPDAEMELVASVMSPTKVAETDRFIAYAVRWPTLDGVFGEGLLLQPKTRAIARIVALPDASQTPEMITGLAPGVAPSAQYARRFVENGCEVIVMTLIDRSNAYSGNSRIGRMTNQPHREWIYRQAFEMGRHVIGYEVQKVMAAVDWCVRRNDTGRLPIGVVGWGEGGLLAFYSAALDPRIDAACVSGYFGRRELVWQEPIYRNIFGLLREFGDAEIARLIVPRRLIVEHASVPATARIDGVTPGRITPLALEDVRFEVERARRLVGPFAGSIQLAPTFEAEGGGFFDGETLLHLLRMLGRDIQALEPIGAKPEDTRVNFSAAERQRRQVSELERFTQQLVPRAHRVREDFLWKTIPVTTPAAWAQATRPFREIFLNDIIGRFPTGQILANARSRHLIDQPKWSGYEVVLDVLPGVFAWGYLLIPNDLKPGEKRPVVVAQHGLEGLPRDVINDDPKSVAYRYYKAFGARLAERGFIVFAPHNPYRGAEGFRILQRKANPLGKSLFSIIIAQHERIIEWLATQPNVDPSRIGFYGLSYGGKTAMRVPAIIEGYALSICSGDFNEWIWKNVTTDWPNSYMFSRGEWEMPDFNLGSTFGYAEMAALIAPRPFMVERGHDDGVGIDEWVAFEYAKVNRLYSRLNIPERTAIEYFVGPHTIHGIGTFQFLHQHLNLPEPTIRP